MRSKSWQPRARTETLERLSMSPEPTGKSGSILGAGLELAAGVAALVGWVAFVGGARLWAQFTAAGLSASPAVAIEPRQYLLVEGAGALAAPLAVSAVAAATAYFWNDLPWQSLRECLEKVVAGTLDLMRQLLELLQRELGSFPGTIFFFNWIVLGVLWPANWIFHRYLTREEVLYRVLIVISLLIPVTLVWKLVGGRLRSDRSEPTNPRVLLQRLFRAVPRSGVAEGVTVGSALTAGRDGSDSKPHEHARSAKLALAFFVGCTLWSGAFGVLWVMGQKYPKLDGAVVRYSQSKEDAVGYLIADSPGGDIYIAMRGSDSSDRLHIVRFPSGDVQAFAFGPRSEVCREHNRHDVLLKDCLEKLKTQMERALELRAP
jgi:hypothetical protein